MRKQTQFNGLWQNMATGVIRFADTEHGVLWERTLEASREVWRQLDVSKSHLRGYLAALSEAGWQMVSSNRDAAREPDAYEAWHGDMFPHGVPLRVSEYACDVVHAAMLACESDAANGWVVDTRGAVHELMPKEREMIRLTMAMDAMNDSWETDATGPEPAMESAETVVVEPVEVEHDGVVDVELAETSETIPVVEAEREPADVEPRTVESSPQLPAECSAETQEIPEVPPQTNENAQVLQVSEHVIPACVTLKEYELTRNVPRKRRREFRDSRGRKCAYVVRADTGAFILWRSWYKHEDAEMDAAVRAYYAQVA